MRCPNCGEELDKDNYCDYCMQFFNDSDDLDFDDSNFYETDFNDDNIEDMVDNGDEICLNCTYWSVSPYGRSHGMYCRRGNGQTEPDDACFEFVQSHSFANYGDNGEFQFDETSRNISNKLNNWRNI